MLRFWAVSQNQCDTDLNNLRLDKKMFSTLKFYFVILPLSLVFEESLWIKIDKL